jgi:putative glutamine amidotransferase
VLVWARDWPPVNLNRRCRTELGEGLVVSAWDADGVVEALELPGEGFVLAVQWHPEESLDDLRLFSAIVEAARSYASGRVSR